MKNREKRPNLSILVLTTRQHNLDRHNICHQTVGESVASQSSFCILYLDKNEILVTSGTKVRVFKIENDEFSLLQSVTSSFQIVNVMKMNNKIIVHEKNELQCFELQEDFSLKEDFEIYYDNEIRKVVMLKNNS